VIQKPQSDESALSRRKGITVSSKAANSKRVERCAASCSFHALSCSGYLNQNKRKFMLKRNPQRDGTVIRGKVEKMGFKRAEAAIYLGITTVTIDRLTKRGLLHPSRALRHPIYSRNDLERFLRETSGSTVETGQFR
jgi:hypothetical protein